MFEPAHGAAIHDGASEGTLTPAVLRLPRTAERAVQVVRALAPHVVVDDVGRVG